MSDHFDSYPWIRRSASGRGVIDLGDEVYIETGKMVSLKSYVDLGDGNGPLLIADVLLPPTAVIAIAQAAEDLAERQRSRRARS
jgi:hypothetical protein